MVLFFLIVFRNHGALYNVMPVFGHEKLLQKPQASDNKRRTKEDAADPLRSGFLFLLFLYFCHGSPHSPP